MKSLRMLTVLAALLVSASAHADNFSWIGVIDDEWGNANNWTLSAGIPGTGDTVQFLNPSPNNNIFLDVSRSVLSASFGGTTDYFLWEGVGGSSLTLESGDLAASGPATHTINSDVVLGANGDWDISNPLFEVSRVITGSRLTKTGGGTLLLTGGDNTTPSS